MKKRNLLSIALTFVLTVYALSAIAQPPPGPDAGAPIDGGAIALLIGAAFMGYKSLKNKGE